MHLDRTHARTPARTIVMPSADQLTNIRATAAEFHIMNLNNSAQAPVLARSANTPNTNKRTRARTRVSRTATSAMANTLNVRFSTNRGAAMYYSGVEMAVARWSGKSVVYFYNS